MSRPTEWEQLQTEAFNLERENAELKAENQGLRERLEASDAALDDEEASSAETFDLWKLREAEAARLRDALESIREIATEMCRETGWLPSSAERIRDKATVAIGDATVQVTDDDGRRIDATR